MFCGKRRREALQERCLTSGDSNLSLRCQQSGFCSLTDAVSAVKEKRLCTGVSSVGQVNGVTGISFPHNTHNLVNNPGVHINQRENFAQPCLVPVSPRRCLRCAAGEPGHINHILG